MTDSALQNSTLILDIFRRGDGRLVLRQMKEEGSEIIETPVQVVYCFPWSHEHEYISLRDDKGKEQILVEQLDALDQATRTLLEEELARRNFLPVITAISNITDQGELVLWDVDTSAGPHHFFTKKNETIRKLSQVKFLVQDVGKDLYLIEDLRQLDEKSREVLWIYLD